MAIDYIKTLSGMKKRADLDLRPICFNSLAVGRMVSCNLLSCPLMGFSDKIGLKEFSRAMRNEELQQVVIVPDELDELAKHPFGAENLIRTSVTCSVLATQFVKAKTSKPMRLAGRPAWSIQGIRSSKSKRTQDPRVPIMQEIGDATTNEQQIFYGPSNGLEWVRGDLATGFIEGCFIHYSSWVPYYPSVDLMAIPCIFRKGSNRNHYTLKKNPKP